MDLTEEQITEKLNAIHAKLDFRHGSMTEELPEQRMAVRFLKGHEKVLELGGNVGRNSCVIASILNANKNTDFVVMESMGDSANKLEENRQCNGLQFFVEPYALSAKPLVQQGWNTHQKTGDEDGGWIDIPTMTYKQLQDKYNIPFDTLVVDCEGCLLPIVRDMPEILDPVKLILVENDYFDLVKKYSMDLTLKKRGFQCIYTEANDFYQAWKKVDS